MPPSKYRVALGATLPMLAQVEPFQRQTLNPHSLSLLSCQLNSIWELDMARAARLVGGPVRADFRWMNIPPPEVVASRVWNTHGPPQLRSLIWKDVAL